MKIGDKVISLVNEMDVIKNGVYEITKIKEIGVCVKDEVGEDYLLYNDEFSALEKDTSPIRTVTRREIVPGVYGRFEVTGTYMKNRVTLDFAPSSVGTSVPIFGMNAEELREAAHLFNQIAEALEENGK